MDHLTCIDELRQSGWLNVTFVHNASNAFSAEPCDACHFVSAKAMPNGRRGRHWSAGLRFTLRLVPAVALESGLAPERSKTEPDVAATPRAPRTTSTQILNRLFHFLGLRYDF